MCRISDTRLVQNKRHSSGEDCHAVMIGMTDGTQLREIPPRRGSDDTEKWHNSTLPKAVKFIKDRQTDVQENCKYRDY